MSTGADDNFYNDGLWAHNEYRTRHNVGLLTIDPELNTSCQKYAEELASTGIFAHSKNRVNAGENLAWRKTSTMENISGIRELINHCDFIYLF